MDLQLCLCTHYANKSMSQNKIFRYLFKGLTAYILDIWWFVLICISRWYSRRNKNEDEGVRIKAPDLRTGHIGKFFIMSTEFDKNISDWWYDCTDHKNGFDFFMRLVKWPKIAIKKCQNLIFKVNFHRQKSSESF